MATNQTPASINAGSLGRNLKMYRIQNNLSQKELADAIEVSSNYISLIETGKKYPSLELIVKIAHTLNIKPHELLDEDPLLDEIRGLTEKYNIDEILDGLYKICGKKHDFADC